MGYGDRIRVLLVEDDEDSRELLAELLRTEYDVLTAADGDQALAMFDRTTPRLVITDESLPGRRGSVLAEEFKRRDPSVRVILVSGYGGLPSGAADLVLKKPLDLERLTAELRGQLTDE